MKTYLFILFFFLTPCLALQDYYQFDSQDKRQRFENLTSQFRCLVCQNQTIADSNAPLAMDLREQIYQKILHLQSDQQIIAYLVERYGEFVLYKPPFNRMTFFLWLGPFFILIMGLSVLLFYIRKLRNK